MAEIDLFLAELGLEAAKRSRWPKPFALFNVGNIPIEGTDRTASSTVGLGMNFPLVDWGDGRRRVERAETEVSTAKRLIVSLARQLWKEHKESFTALALARRNLDQNKHFASILQRRVELTKELLAEGRLDSAFGFQTEIEHLRAMIECHRSRLEFQRAWVAWLLNTGREFEPSLVDRVMAEIVGQYKLGGTLGKGQPAWREE